MPLWRCSPFGSGSPGTGVARMEAMVRDAAACSSTVRGALRWRSKANCTRRVGAEVEGNFLPIEQERRGDVRDSRITADATPQLIVLGPGILDRVGVFPQPRTTRHHRRMDQHSALEHGT